MPVTAAECRTADDVRAVYARVSAWKKSLIPAQPQLRVVASAKPRRDGGPIEAWVLRVVASHFDVTIHEIQCCLRDERFIEPRHIAMRLLRRIAEMKVKTIAEMMHRTHPTICKAIAKVEQRMESDETYKQLMLKLEAECLQ